MAKQYDFYLVGEIHGSLTPEKALSYARKFPIKTIALEGALQGPLNSHTVETLRAQQETAVYENEQFRQRLQGLNIERLNDAYWIALGEEFQSAVSDALRNTINNMTRHISVARQFLYPPAGPAHNHLEEALTLGIPVVGIEDQQLLEGALQESNAFFKSKYCRSRDDGRKILAILRGKCSPKTYETLLQPVGTMIEAIDQLLLEEGLIEVDTQYQPELVNASQSELMVYERTKAWYEFLADKPQTLVIAGAAHVMPFIYLSEQEDKTHKICFLNGKKERKKEWVKLKRKIGL